MVEEERKVEKKPEFDAVAVFQRVAKSGKSITKINTHSIEEELEERNQRALSGETPSVPQPP